MCTNNKIYITFLCIGGEVYPDMDKSWRANVLTRMEIFGCNNLVSYKVAIRLKIPWICNVFYLVATLLNGCKHLVTTLK